MKFEWQLAIRIVIAVLYILFAATYVAERANQSQVVTHLYSNWR